MVFVWMYIALIKQYFAPSFSRIRYLAQLWSSSSCQARYENQPTQMAQFCLNKAEIERITIKPRVINKSKTYALLPLPPIRYQDGSIRIKLGGSPLIAMTHPDIYVSSNNHVIKWHRSNGDDGKLADMAKILHGFVPNLTSVRAKCSTRANLETTDDLAGLVGISHGSAVATNGNGCATKSVHELDSLAAVCQLRPKNFEREEIILKVFPNCFDHRSYS